MAARLQGLCSPSRAALLLLAPETQASPSCPAPPYRASGTLRQEKPPGQAHRPFSRAHGASAWPFSSIPEPTLSLAAAPSPFEQPKQTSLVLTGGSAWQLRNYLFSLSWSKKSLFKKPFSWGSERTHLYLHGPTLLKVNLRKNTDYSTDHLIIFV